ncbi:MAG TPA: SHOCT domain-containing protein [Candidatus Nanoarchaeia archaeon]|nr:SHOCT domain-containing protein [Candidatus Nanoarchaeia archaeon]
MEENKNVLVWVLAAAALLFLFGSFGMGGYGMMGFGTGFGSIFMLLFWGVVLWLVVTLINAGQSGKKEEDPSIILKKRYASGEISKKRYGEMKKELK